MQVAKYLRIALNTPVRRSFDYLPPKNCDLTKLQIGQRVRVPFGSRELIGILLETATDTQVAKNKLKQVKEILDDVPVMPSDLIQLVKWIADYYQHNIGEVFACVLPNLLVKGEQASARQAKFWVLAKDISDDFKDLELTVRQRENLQIFGQHPSGISEKLMQTL